MAGSRHVEVERKYAVGLETGLPDLTSLGVVAKMRHRPDEELVALYYDTAELDLLRHQVTVRRRVGGADEGWHLKQPSGPDARTETQLPLGRAGHSVPTPLLSAVAALTGGRPLVAVARVSTRRAEHELVGPGGTVLAVLCDDDVHAERLLVPRLKQHWREWEVELSGAPHELLDTLEPALLIGGARAAGVSSKLARALVRESPTSGPPPSRGELRARGSSAWEVLAAYLAEHLTVLQEHEPALQGPSVHRLRIAARRLRSALTTYRPLFASGAVNDLGKELGWLGRALGAARDVEVLREHLDALAADEPDRFFAATLRRRIQEDMDASHRVGHRTAVEAVASERYRLLLRSLEAVVESPDLRSRASTSARSVLPDLLERDARQVRRSVRAARRTDPGPSRDRALHEVRKKTKRLRYAAESASPILGRRARRLAARAEALQECLGAHQDAVACRAWLEDLAARATDDAALAFGAGRLHAGEEQRAHTAEEEYEQAWRRLNRRHVDT